MKKISKKIEVPKIYFEMTVRDFEKFVLISKFQEINIKYNKKATKNLIGKTCKGFVTSRTFY